MSLIVPIKELKDTNKFSNLCKNTEGPIFVTKNGYGDMVVMNLQYYQHEMDKLNIRKQILEGLEDEKEGRVLDGPKALKQLRKKYDF